VTPSSFVGSAYGTKVTIGSGNHNVDEDDRCPGSQQVFITVGGATFQFNAEF